MMRILENLMGESGKFYLDIAQILQAPPPQAIKSRFMCPFYIFNANFFSISFPKEFSLSRNQFAFLWNLSGLSLR